MLSENGNVHRLNQPGTLAALIGSYARASLSPFSSCCLVDGKTEIWFRGRIGVEDNLNTSDRRGSRPRPRIRSLEQKTEFKRQ
jgi:hypothetical protein